MTPRSVIDPSGQFALDANALGNLRQQAKTAPREALAKVAGQFEALFTQMLLKQMREALPQDGPLSSDTTRSYTAMFDQQIAQQLSNRGIGLRKMIETQLARQLGAAQDGASPGPAGTADPAPASPQQGDAITSGQSALAAAVTALAGASAVAAGRKAASALGASASGGLRPAAAAAYGAAAGPAAYGALAASASAAPKASASTPVAGPASAAPVSPAGTSPASPAGTSAASPVSSAARPGLLPTAVQAFVDKLRPHAEAAAKAMGVPAEYLLAQAGLETGWGRSLPAAANGGSSHNLFGVKAGAGWTGAVAQAKTTEYENGRAVQSAAHFRSYGSFGEAFQDFAKLLRTSPRYSGVLAHADDPNAYAAGLQRAGYATDPLYGAKLARAIQAVARYTGWSASQPVQAAAPARDATGAGPVQVAARAVDKRIVAG